jgi:hypothetical protein
MNKVRKLTTLSVYRETLQELGTSDVVSEIFKTISLPQIRPGLATAIESEAGATKIISDDDLGHDY